MTTLTNAEISRLCNVTRATVTNWVANAMQKENNLELVTNNNKVQVIKNEHNLAELNRLKILGQKHSNKAFLKETKPDDKFYSLFSDSQIIEIINSLKTSKEISLKYTYINGGAKIWNDYHIESIKNGQYSATQKESKMLCQSLEFLRDRLESFEKVNVVDVGPGNALIAKNFIDLLNKEKKLNKYIAVDISIEMNQIAIANIKQWLPDIQTESYVRDVENENIADILYKNKKQGHTINIVLFVGGTLGSLTDKYQFLRNLRASVDEGDIVIFTTKLDNLTDRVELEHIKDKSSRLLWIPQMLGVDVENCDIIRKYDDRINAKTAYLVLDKDYTIKFNFSGVETVINLLKNEQILIWQFHLSTISELINELDKSKLRIIQLITEKKYEYILVSCESML
jgi:uncharacterized SAM-dependent methyltransferase